MSETFWAIRRRELAKHEEPVKKGKKAKKEKVVVIEEPAEEEAPVVEVEDQSDGGEAEAAVPAEAENEEVAE